MHHLHSSETAPTLSTHDTRSSFGILLERGDRICTQKHTDQHQRCAVHATEVECTREGEASKHCEVGVKVSFAVACQRSLTAGAKRFTGYPFDGHLLVAGIKRSNEPVANRGRAINEADIDPGYRVNKDNLGVRVRRQGRIKSTTSLGLRRLFSPSTVTTLKK